MDIQSSIEELSATAKKIVVSVPSNMLKERYNQELSKYTRQAQIKGFRPGKAPAELVKKMYGEEVRARVTQDLISSSLRDVAKQNSLSIVGTPKLTLDETGLEQGIKYTANVSIYPRPEVTGYSSFSIEVPNRSVTDKEIDDVVQYLRKNRAELTPITDRSTLAEGDVADVEIAIFDEGAEPGRAEPFAFCLGEKVLPEEVEKVFAGMAVGEQRDALIDRPAGSNQSAEGQSKPRLVYRATLKALKSRVLPELTDEFAKLADPTVDSVSALKAKISSELSAQREEERVADQNGAIIEKLLEINKFDVPQELVDEEIIAILERRGMIEPGKYTAESFPMEIVRKDMNDSALSRVRAAIIVDRVAELESIKLEKEDIEGAVAAAAKQYRMSPQEAGKILLGEGRATGFLVETLRNKVLGVLRSRATVTEKTGSDEKKGS